MLASFGRSIRMPTKDVFETFEADLRDPEFIVLVLQQLSSDRALRY
jgi:hypothetical protein